MSSLALSSLSLAKIFKQPVLGCEHFNGYGCVVCENFRFVSSEKFYFSVDDHMPKNILVVRQNQSRSSIRFMSCHLKSYLLVCAVEIAERLATAAVCVSADVLSQPQLFDNCNGCEVDSITAAIPSQGSCVYIALHPTEDEMLLELSLSIIAAWKVTLHC